MSTFKPGLVHALVTPFTADYAVDWTVYEKLIEFHLKHGAQALAVPMHVGESVSLSDEEQRKLVSFVIERVQRRVPVIAHVSDAGTSIAAARAAHADQAGAAAVVATVPYYWTPPADMLVEHFAAIAQAVRVPFFVWHTPEEIPGTKVTTALVMKLIERFSHFSGVVDSSNDWQWQINVVSNARRVRSDFQLLAGSEYLASAGANGATGMISGMAGVAPVLVRRLFEICRKEQYVEARKLQEALAVLYQTVKHAGVGGLKHAIALMGRDCGVLRPPLSALSDAASAALMADLQRCDVLAAEPRGW
jgi:4-hydroxy-tetrahydrodipicolinate synthase